MRASPCGLPDLGSGSLLVQVSLTSRDERRGYLPIGDTLPCEGLPGRPQDDSPIASFIEWLLTYCVQAVGGGAGRVDRARGDGDSSGRGS